MSGKSSDMFGGGVTVWEQGNLISVPLLKSKAKHEKTHIWTVVRIF